MINDEYSNAYTEVYEILKYIPKVDYEKLPKNMINLLKCNKNDNYVFRYDVNKTLTEQNVSKKAKTIIAIFFRDYWATSKQREIIKANEERDFKLLEEEKQKKYNIDFEKLRSQRSVGQSLESSNLPVLVEKDNLFVRFFKFIKGLLKLN